MASSSANTLPEGFVYLSDVNQDIVQAIRYSGPENALGRPLQGYKRNVCIVTKELGEKLDRIQQKLHKEFNLCLVVYDSYRPRKAVEDFWEWANMPSITAEDSNNNDATSSIPISTIGTTGIGSVPAASSSAATATSTTTAPSYDPDKMGPKYFPKFVANSPSNPNNNQSRATLFEKGYISKRSNHARGSTVDVTIVFWEDREDVRVGKLIPVLRRGGITHLKGTNLTDAACGHSNVGTNSRDTIANKGQLLHLPEFRAFDSLMKAYVVDKLTVGQQTYLAALERDTLKIAGNAADRNRGESEDMCRAVGFDRSGPYPFIDDYTIDMGTSFDLFDAASHPMWPGVFLPLRQSAIAAEKQLQNTALFLAAASSIARASTDDLAHSQFASGCPQRGGFGENSDENNRTASPALGCSVGGAVTPTSGSRPMSLGATPNAHGVTPSSVDAFLSSGVESTPRKASAAAAFGASIPASTVQYPLNNSLRRSVTPTLTNSSFSSSMNHGATSGGGGLTSRQGHALPENTASLLLATAGEGGGMNDDADAKEAAWALLPDVIISHPIYHYRRMFLQCVMEEEGFIISDEEWWHFWLRDGEPFPPREDDPEYGFNFDVE